MATYEVFLKKDGRDEFRHAGALDAANDELALVMARESYIRRAEGNRVWIVNRDDIICLLYTSPSPRDQRGSRMPSSA